MIGVESDTKEEDCNKLENLKDLNYKKNCKKRMRQKSCEVSHDL